MAKYYFPLGFLLTVLPVYAFAAEVAAIDGPVSISAKADTITPYQDEPVRYTVRCVSRAGLSNVTLSDPAVENAIVTRQGEPDVHVAIENGMPAKVVDFHYLITPMQPGKMIIPPISLQGNIETDDREMADDLFGGNLMAGVRQVMKALSNFTNGRPFHIASNATLLEVKPPAVAMDPWLPLKSLKIEEDTAALQQPQVGEPMIRKITLSAVGAVGSQLPDTEAQEDHDDFRVYADRPAVKTDIDKETGVISSQRTESYSMVPQRAGRLVLPAIRVSWWDTVSNRAATAVLPARTISVQPGVPVQNSAVPVVDATGGAPGTESQPASYWARKLLANTMPLLPYGALAVLAILSSLGGVFGGVRLWRTVRGRRRGGTPMDKKNPLRGSRSPDTLKQVRTAEELSAFLHAYAQQQWGASKNAPLERIFPMLPQLPKASEDAEILVAALTGAIYAGKTVDIEDLKMRARRLLAVLKRQPGLRRRGADKLPSLNPS
jgi:hypothetical protein